MADPTPAHKDWMEGLWRLITEWDTARRALDRRRAAGELMNADYHDAVSQAEEAIDAYVLAALPAGVALPREGSGE